MVFYYEIIENIQFLIRKIQKNNLCVLLFNFTFSQCVFLVNENLVSKYEQLLI